MRTDAEIAALTLRHGAEFPYDGQTSPVDWAHAAARGVLADLLDRRGIKWELAKVDPDVRIEIVAAVAAIIRAADAERTPAPQDSAAGGGK